MIRLWGPSLTLDSTCLVPVRDLSPGEEQELEVGAGGVSVVVQQQGRGRGVGGVVGGGQVQDVAPGHLPLHRVTQPHLVPAVLVLLPTVLATTSLYLWLGLPWSSSVPQPALGRCSYQLFSFDLLYEIS